MSQKAEEEEKKQIHKNILQLVYALAKKAEIKQLLKTFPHNSVAFHVVLRLSLSEQVWRFQLTTTTTLCSNYSMC